MENSNNRALRLLRLLASKPDEYIKSNEIEKYLNMKKRNIPYLIDKLKILGYNIDSQAGYYGGYKLIDDFLLTKNELTIILESLDTYAKISQKKKNYLFNKISDLNKKVKI